MDKNIEDEMETRLFTGSNCRATRRQCILLSHVVLSV